VHPAAEIVRDAAETLAGAVTRGDGVRVPRAGLDAFPANAFNAALTLLTEAQRCLDLGVGGGTSAVAEAMVRIREASDAIDSTRGFVRWMPADVVHARADTLRRLDQITVRW
jgi:hypothetical protein